MNNTTTKENKQPHELERKEWGLMGIKNYKGILVIKLIGGYSVFGKKVKTPEEVDQLINEARETIKKSIQ